MPYKCVHCSEVYEDGSSQVLSGCDGCRGKFFFYIKPEQVEKIKEYKEEDLELSSSEKKQIEKDVRDISGIEDEETPVFLDFESVKIIKPGKYLLDLGNLFAINKPRVYKLEDGKYIVDLSSKLRRE
ncbi:MAG: Zn-ribbon containing protein [Nanoarchaeota archaeon]